MALRTKRASGFAVVETMIAVGLLAIVASSTVYAMVSSNRFVVSQRYVSNAKALCQERIDDALMRPFTPIAIPEFFGTTWPLPAAETITQTEPISIYATAGSDLTKSPPDLPLVPGTRITRVQWFTGNGGADFARVRVRVEFWVNGRGINNKLQSQPGSDPFFYEMTTLRAPD